MKRTALVIFIFLLLQSFGMANIFVDGFGDLSYQGDAKMQFGGGLALAADFTDDLRAIYRFSYTSRTLHGDELSSVYPRKKETYSSIGNSIGIEYIYTFLNQWGWRNSLLLGVNSLKREYFENLAGPPVSSSRKTIDDTGVLIQAFTGIQYTLSQHVLPFIDFGYHYSYFAKEFSGNSITGFTVLVGVRVAVFEMNTIGSEY